MADPRFFQKGIDKQLAHVVGECGEVLAAAGKVQQWGWDSVNPLLPVEEQETNRDWLVRELDDLKGAIARLEETLFQTGCQMGCSCPLHHESMGRPGCGICLNEGFLPFPCTQCGRLKETKND